MEAIKNCESYNRDKLHRKDCENIKRPWRTIENTIKFQSDRTRKVVNLSKKTFSKETFQLSHKNLNFVLKPKVCNKHKLNEEMEIKLRGYFKDLNEDAVPTEEIILKPTSHKKWASNKNHHTVLTYIEATQEELECKIGNQKPQPFNNLTKDERKALQELSKIDDIVIRKTDKGAAVFIVDVKDYIREAESQLKNKDNYDRLKYDPTETHSRLINDTIERFKKQKMKEKVAKGLKTENPRTAKFYLQPKIHKRGNPGHPVVSSVNCHTSNISEYVGYHMQPIAKEIPSSCFTFCH